MQRKSTGQDPNLNYSNSKEVICAAIQLLLGLCAGRLFTFVQCGQYLSLAECVCIETALQIKGILCNVGISFCLIIPLLSSIGRVSFFLFNVLMSMNSKLKMVLEQSV